MTSTAPTLIPVTTETAATPKLHHHELVAAQAETLAAPRLRYDIVSRIMFLTVDVIYGRKATLAKFRFLEKLAQIPYRVWERVARRAMKSQHEFTVVNRIYERVVEAQAQQENEGMHHAVLDEMLTRRGQPERFWRDRVLVRLLAGPYHLFAWVLHLVKPEWSYRLNANFEDHAEHTYMEYVAAHPEHEDELFVGEMASRYGRYRSVADALRQIGHDERFHKLGSLAAAGHARPEAITEGDFGEAA